MSLNELKQKPTLNAIYFLKISSYWCGLHLSSEFSFEFPLSIFLSRSELFFYHDEYMQDKAIWSEGNLSCVCERDRKREREGRRKGGIMGMHGITRRNDGLKLWLTWKFRGLCRSLCVLNWHHSNVFHCQHTQKQEHLLCIYHRITPKSPLVDVANCGSYECWSLWWGLLWPI